MTYIIAMLATLVWGPDVLAHEEPGLGHNGHEFYGFEEESPIITTEFYIERDLEQPNTMTVKASVFVDSSCIQISYDVYRKGDFTHYIDFFVEEDGSHCLMEAIERTAVISLEDLPAGIHTVSIMGPDGKEWRKTMQLSSD